MISPEQVLSFWLDELKPADWYNASPELDQRIRDKFEEAWKEATQGAYGLWLTHPTGTLAYIILTDQFPRNMFRGSALAFSTDRNALAAAKVAIARGWDKKIDEPARQFFYLPLMHSENLCDQDRCVRLMCSRMGQTGEQNLLHAKVHREIIRQFGRFPYRNDALSRETTRQEKLFTETGGYAAILDEIRSAQAA
ncbi:MAG: DUF924 domain-containing protein [Paracoccaceae bacterium]|nr:DUF924 domain-containing protein [Paracoccaceae bacterium]